MSATGATKETLFRVIRERDEEIVRLQKEIAALKAMLDAIARANMDLLVTEGYV